LGDPLPALHSYVPSNRNASMPTPRRLGLIIFLLASAAASQSAAETIAGSNLALRSDGSSSGGNYTLTANGYVGTYITLSSPASVTVDVQASGTSGPQMDVVIDDAKATYNVSSGTYSHVFSLPAGTHFLRAQLSNDPGIAGRQLTVNSVSVTGASFSNSNSNANALAASDTYITHYRQGSVSVKTPFAPGTQVGVTLKRLAFDWGAGIHMSGTGELLDNTNTTYKQVYQQHLLENFNTIATAGSGYWDETEPTRGQTQLAGILEVQNFAAAHNLHTRLHNLLWENNQPGWVQTLKQNATTSNSAKSDLANAIATRESYYLGNGMHFNEADIYNESWNDGENNPGNTESYWALYGAAGIAKIYHDSAILNPFTKTFVNDYAVLQGSSDSFGRHLDTINGAGYGNVVGGIGLQYYTGNVNPAAASSIFYGLQNMNVRNLPTVMTEFGTFTSVSATDSATLLGQAMRLFFGNPTSTGFVIWDWENEAGASDQWAPNAALYDANGSSWTITEAGKTWQDALGIHDWDGNATNGWTTQLTSTVGADGKINFTGYYGDYELSAGGQTFNLTLTKGITNYAVPFPIGDFDFDGAVNAADYVTWRKSDDTPAGYGSWRSNFGVASGPILQWASVPEPAGVFLAAWYVILLRRRRVHRGWRADKASNSNGDAKARWTLRRHE
jgi:GH35 family endo-1,4-beta-xylanase